MLNAFSVKNLATMGLAASLSFSAFAQLTETFGLNQSYAINTSGSVSGFSVLGGGYFDKLNGLFVMPGNVEVAGSNYFILDNDDIHTVNADGITSFYDGYEYSGSLKVKAGNFFITSKGDIHTVNHQGTIQEFKKGSPAIKEFNLKKIKMSGGSFMVTGASQFLNVNYKGFVSQITDIVGGGSTDISQDQVANSGNNYILKTDGTLVTLGQSEVTGTDGGKYIASTLFNKSGLVGNISPSSVVKAGGNYLLVKNTKNKKQLDIITVGLNGNAYNKGPLKFDFVNKKGKVIKTIDYTKDTVTANGGNYLVMSKNGKQTGVVIVDYAGNTTSNVAKTKNVGKSNL